MCEAGAELRWDPRRRSRPGTALPRAARCPASDSLAVAVAVLGILGPGLAGPSLAASASYLVLYERESIPEDAQAVIEAAGGDLASTVESIGVAFATSDDSEFAANLSRSRDVEAVGDFSGLEVADGRISSAPDPEPPEASEGSSGVSAGLVFDCDFADDPATPEIDGPTADDVWYCPYEWHLHRINAPGAWRLGATGSHDTIVAVIDTGIAESAPDLAPNLVIQECFLDEPSGASCSTTYPGDGHGTGVASVVAAVFGGGPHASGSPDAAPFPLTRGGGPMVGVGPDLGLASYKVTGCFDEGCPERVARAVLLSLQDVIEKHAAGIPIDVVNMSIGFGVRPRDPRSRLWPELRAITRMIHRANRAGIVTVIAAGNDAFNSRQLRNFDLGFNVHPEAIIVGGTGYDPHVFMDGKTPVFPTDSFVDRLVAYSNFGSAIDVVAPAGDLGSCRGCSLAQFLYHGVVFTEPTTFNPTCIANRNCAHAVHIGGGGTSRAAPHVAAAAALVIDRAKERGIQLRPQQVKRILIRTAQDLGDRQVFGHGIVDVEAAIREVDAMTRGYAED